MTNKATTAFAVFILFLSLGVNADSRPNVLLIVSDDQRWDQLGVVQRELGANSRFPFLETPRLDQLANEGTRFRNAFVTTSLCSPSRASILTGLYSHAHGIRDNTTELGDQPNWASLLRRAGYATGFFGKWHHGMQVDRPGFESFATFRGQGNYENTRFYINNTWLGLPRPGYVDENTVDYAIDFMRDHVDEPFAAMVGFKAVHQPFTPMEEHNNRYAGADILPASNWNAIPPWSSYKNPLPPDIGTQRPGFWWRILKTIDGLDKNVGRLLDALDAMGLADNTLVIFTSDNGYHWREHMLGDKRSAYEESIRVPMIMRLPKVIPAGSVVDNLVLNIDIAPTILELAQRPPPKWMDGMSLGQLFRGDTSQWRDAFLYEYWQTSFHPKPGARTGARNSQLMPTMVSIRTRTHKLVTYTGYRNRTELFDLVNDPKETRNLARFRSHIPVLNEMCSQLDTLVRETGYVYEPPIARWLTDLPRPDNAGASYEEITANYHRPPLLAPRC